jgi:lipoprotein-anchoring transpeptidase ErfK/SrfK
MGTVAMVLKFDGKQSIYRLHGTNEPQSIGKRASSGCIRMKNEDIEELAKIIFDFKTKIIVYYEKIPVE